MHLRLCLPIAGLIFASYTEALTWCGKNYKPNEPIVHPGGKFPIPASSASSLLALRCAQTIRPYLPDDGHDKFQPVSILIDAPVVYSLVNGAKPITIPDPSHPGSLDVTVSVDGHMLAKGSVPLNATKHELPFSLSSLQPRRTAYKLTCNAVYGSQTFIATSLLTYLPNPPSDIGSVTKTDLRTGALLARPADGKGGPYSPVFPVGFYTDFGNYLARNLSIPAELASQGFSIVHPIPSFDNITRLEEVLDAIQAAGLYLMYDMRFTYMNSSVVTKEVNRIKSRPNLLLWYTADEPDGTSDPFSATATANDLIVSLDGGDGDGGVGYHPVSLVLNCQDYYFTQYARGADIVLQDVYPIGNNVTFSSVYGTICTPDYGVCGCDNCKGSFEDITNRMDEFRERFFFNGWERTKAAWAVPQGFGSVQFWKRTPTGKEFNVQSIIAINHGALGVVSWTDPTTADIKASASLLAKSFKHMTRFILNPSATFRQMAFQGVDVGLWTVGQETLILAANTNYEARNVALKDLGLHVPHATVVQVLNSGSQVTDEHNGNGCKNTGFSVESVGSGGFIVSKCIDLGFCLVYPMSTSFIQSIVCLYPDGA